MVKCNCSACNPLSQEEVDQAQKNWETSGEEEYKKLLEESNEKISVVQIRDRLDNLRSLVDLCSMAGSCKEWSGQAFMQEKIAEVLYDFVSPEIKRIEQDLRKI